MKVYVVMSNDFPDRVFVSEKSADTFCKEKMDAQKNPLEPYMEPYKSPRIYWRAYEFEVIEDA